MRNSVNLFILFLIGCIFVSCEKDKEVFISPQLVFSSDTISFNGEGVEVKNIYISTKPVSECNYQVISYPDWVDVYPLSGSIFQNIKELNVVSKSEKKPGLYTGKLVVLSTLGTDTIYLKRFIGECLLYDVQDSIAVSAFNKEGKVVIKNQGNIALRYTMDTSNKYISFSAGSGNIDLDKEGALAFSVNRDLMETGTYESKIFLNINDKKDTIIVKIENIKEKKIILRSEIIDAEFSKVNNKIIYVSENPSSLVIYDVVNKSSDLITLRYIPTCVSVSKDGKYAVVGHDGKISHIDLLNKKYIKTIDVPCPVSDIVLNGNWAYVAPEKDQHVYIQSVNLIDGTVEPNSGWSVYEGSRMKLHPSGKYIYLIDNRTMPEDIHKFDIQNGRAVNLYDSPYHGDYAMGRDIWFSEDGNRIFSMAGAVFKTSEIQSKDILYNGKINLVNSSYYGSAYIKSLAHSASKNNLYLITSTYPSNSSNDQIFFYIHDADNLSFKEKVQIEKYLVMDGVGRGGIYDPIPHFIFTNTSGNKVYVLATAQSSGLAYDWSFQEFDVK